MKTHELKVHFDFWPPLQSGDKPFECRLDDRGYEVGDELVLRPIAYTNGHNDNDNSFVYLEGELRKRVTYILTADKYPGLKEGYVVLGLGDAALAKPAGGEHE